jgi:fructosamine-3-kinase
LSTDFLSLKTNFELALQRLFGNDFDLLGLERISGSSHGQTYKLKSSAGCYFLKLAPEHQAAALSSEAADLEYLQSTQFRVPIVYGLSTTEVGVCLITEYLNLRPVEDWSAYAQSLAHMHVRLGEHFGWPQDNYIGATPQNNTVHCDWISFWQNARLRPQLQWAAPSLNQAERNLIEEVVQATPTILAHHLPACSLVHGDLWSGNMAQTDQGQPALFDPALYFGDHETDLAMMELFGSVPAQFYQSYDKIWPPESQYQQRKLLYNLYHLLNHVNIFGRSYLPRVIDTARQLLNAI